MADHTIASSVNIEKGNQNEEYCVEQVISFQQQTNMEKVFDEVVYPEESTLKKMNHVAVTVSRMLDISAPGQFGTRALRHLCETFRHQDSSAPGQF
jgi:hypothetical protein